MRLSISSTLLHMLTSARGMASRVSALCGAAMFLVLACEI